MDSTLFCNRRVKDNSAHQVWEPIKNQLILSTCQLAHSPLARSLAARLFKRWTNSKQTAKSKLFSVWSYFLKLPYSNLFSRVLNFANFVFWKKSRKLVLAKKRERENKTHEI